ncbi:ABC transporter [Microbacterium plantarum]|uniref:ABC transporter n=1 Tax=Microbacterium plantarum TaxID=1816425 RepID=UPI002B490B13|nr:ABC transporter [Microbacterium plantarum]WRK17011.1 ABC transporter [Microbacterium plantarum]
MSDPKYGEPVEEPKPVDDVVGSARAGLADAEASRDAVSADDWDAAYAGSGTLPERSASADASTDRPVADGATSDADAARIDAAAARDERTDTVGSSSDDAWNSPSEWDTPRDAEADAAATTDRDAAAGGAAGAAAATTAAGGAAASDTATRAYRADDTDAGATRTVSASEPVAETPAAAAPSPQPIFVQAPEAPTPRGNRGAAGAIGLLAAIAFALIYLGAALGIDAVRGEVTTANVGDQALAAATSWWFWVPVVVFFLAFWVLGAFINRGRWGLWVLLGLLVGLASYAGHIAGQLFQAPFWTIAPSQALTIVGEQAFAPLALVALVAGRELTIWFGAWVAARGRRVTELNAEAQREYERTLEAGPQLHRY